MTVHDIPSSVRDTIRRALEEDIGCGDVTTTSLIPADAVSRAHIVAKGACILAGSPFARAVFRMLDADVEWASRFSDGDVIHRGDIIAEISGRTRTILTGERVSLNILQRLSGIATLTRAYVEKIHGTRARIADTRKTQPCMRYLEKYAVRIGGGTNHRFGLFDGILIKNNHLAAVGSIPEAIARARSAHYFSKIEIEVERLDDLVQAIEAGADIVMLDNMSIPDMREAVRIAHGKVILEASGGVTLDNVREIAETGVDIISVGALTHSASAVDIGLQLIP